MPLHPLRKHAIILYTFAIALSFSFLFLFNGSRLFQAYVSLVSIMISSQVYKVITKLRKESVMGTYQFHFDEFKIANGVYFCCIEAGKYKQVNKIMLQK